MKPTPTGCDGEAHIESEWWPKSPNLFLVGPSWQHFPPPTREPVACSVARTDTVHVTDPDSRCVAGLVTKEEWGSPTVYNCRWHVPRRVHDVVETSLTARSGDHAGAALAFFAQQLKAVDGHEHDTAPDEHKANPDLLTPLEKESLLALASFSCFMKNHPDRIKGALAFQSRVASVVDVPMQHVVGRCDTIGLEWNGYVTGCAHPTARTRWSA